MTKPCEHRLESIKTRGARIPTADEPPSQASILVKSQLRLDDQAVFLALCDPHLFVEIRMGNWLE